PTRSNIHVRHTGLEYCPSSSDRSQLVQFVTVAQLPQRGDVSWRDTDLLSNSCTMPFHGFGSIQILAPSVGRFLCALERAQDALTTSIHREVQLHPKYSDAFIYSISTLQYLLARELGGRNETCLYCVCRRSSHFAGWPDADFFRL